MKIITEYGLIYEQPKSPLANKVEAGIPGIASRTKAHRRGADP